MPFSQTTPIHSEAYWTQHFQLLKQVIEEGPDLEAHRSQPLREDILNGIITDLIVSDIVVADLTDHNSNVFWELGVRQSFKHGTITIAEVGTKLPFDQMAKATLFYNVSKNVEWEEFRKRLKQAVKDCVENPNKPDSPVLENITGRGTLFELFRRDETLRRLDALSSQLLVNDVYLTHLGETVKRNQEDPSKRTFAPGRFALSATELLATNRYLDEKPDFYDSFEKYYDWLLTFNSQLELWEQAPDEMEKWFLKMMRENNSGKLFRGIRDRVKAARSQVEKRF